MLTFVRTVLILWFFFVSGLVLFPSYSLLRSAPIAPAAPMPAPPDAPVDLFPPAPSSSTDPAAVARLLKEDAVIATARATIYTQQVAAYKARLDAVTKSPSLSTYETVVKGTLAGLLSTFFVTLLGLAFTKGVVGVIQNRLRIQKQDIKDVELF